MNKVVIWIVVIIVIVLIGGYFLFTAGTRTSEMSPSATVAGTVTAVNLDQVTFDGPALVTIQTEAGDTEVIAVPSMGLPLCAAYGDIADVYTLEVGSTVAVAGERDEEDRIVPCDDASHYFRVTSAEVLAE